MMKKLMNLQKSRHEYCKKLMAVTLVGYRECLWCAGSWKRTAYMLCTGKPISIRAAVHCSWACSALRHFTLSTPSFFLGSFFNLWGEATHNPFCTKNSSSEKDKVKQRRNKTQSFLRLHWKDFLYDFCYYFFFFFFFFLGVEEGLENIWSFSDSPKFSSEPISHHRAQQAAPFHCNNWKWKQQSPSPKTQWRCGWGKETPGATFPPALSLSITSLHISVPIPSPPPPLTTAVMNQTICSATRQRI